MVRLVRPPLFARPRTVTGRPASPDVTLYTARKTNLPLTGGQNQAFATGSPGTAQTQVGPQGLGTIWYPAQVTVSTSTGLASGFDASLCSIYLGATGLPTTLQGTIFGGNGLLGVALPPITVGLFIIAKWTNAHAGDVCAINVQGLMSALMMA
jgi:hypothetical protein